MIALPVTSGRIARLAENWRQRCALFRSVVAQIIRDNVRSRRDRPTAALDAAPGVRETPDGNATPSIDGFNSQVPRMMPICRRVGLVALLLTLTTTVSRADNWPAWRGIRH